MQECQKTKTESKHTKMLTRAMSLWRFCITDVYYILDRSTTGLTSISSILHHTTDRFLEPMDGSTFQKCGHTPMS